MARHQYPYPYVTLSEGARRLDIGRRALERLGPFTKHYTPHRANQPLYDIRELTRAVRASRGDPRSVAASG